MVLVDVFMFLRYVWAQDVYVYIDDITRQAKLVELRRATRSCRKQIWRPQTRAQTIIETSYLHARHEAGKFANE